MGAKTNKEDVLALAAWIEREGSTCQRHIEAAAVMKALVAEHEAEVAARQQAQRQLESTQAHAMRLCHTKDIEKSQLIAQVESLKALIDRMMSAKPVFKHKVLRTGGSGTLSPILQGGYETGLKHMAAQFRKTLKAMREAHVGKDSGVAHQAANESKPAPQ